MVSGRLAVIQNGCVLLLYLAISVAYFVLPLLGHFGHRIVGGRADPMIQMWMLAWWPHALASGINPIITQSVWPPDGYNLAWVPSMPAPSLALYPVTRWFGPIVAYNVLCLSGPSLA